MSHIPSCTDPPEEGAEAPASGRSLVGAWPEPVENNTKRVLAGSRQWPEPTGRSHYDKLHSNVFRSRKASIRVGLRLINDKSNWN